jgi:DnaJ like chaperone protein
MALFFIILVFVAVMAFKIKNNVDNDREWHEGIFEGESNSYEEQLRDPLLESYISLGALMVRNDTSSYREKILYLNSYFSKYFPDTHYDFGRSFTESFKNPIRPEAISKWLRRNLPEQKQRVQIMYFLAGISTVDGSMNTREMALLKEINTLLELSEQDLESIVAMYTQKRERNERTASSKPRLSAIQLACKIIGISEQASMLEIKKAYRTLVKLHHPDRFATESLAQQQIAEQKFIEIQKAYEVLERR